MSNLEKVKKEVVLEEAVFVGAVQELQNCIANPKADYPGDLIEKVLAQREQSTPKLLAIAEKFFTYSQRDITYEQWREAMVAFFILSKFREKKAFPLVARLCKFPYEVTEVAIGDIVTEDLPEFLASTFNGDWEALYSIVTNQHFEEFSRAAVIEVYGILYMNGIMSRNQILSIFSKLFDELYDDFSYVPTALVAKCADICAVELSDKVEKYFANDVVNTDAVSLKEVKESFSTPLYEVPAEMQAHQTLGFTDDLEDMWWLFRKDENEDECELEAEQEYKASKEYESGEEDLPF